MASRTRHSWPGTPGRSSNAKSWRSAFSCMSPRGVRVRGAAAAGATHGASFASVTPPAAATCESMARASVELTDSTNEPVKRVRGTIERPTTAPVTRDRRVSPTVTTSSTWPRRESAAERPVQLNVCCADRMKIVSPFATAPSAAVATAAQPTRAPAAGPAANPSNVHSGRSGTTASSSETPSRSASARDEAPTSTQSWSTPTIVVSARCWRAKCPFAIATTPGTSPRAV